MVIESGRLLLPAKTAPLMLLKLFAGANGLGRFAAEVCGAMAAVTGRRNKFPAVIVGHEPAIVSKEFSCNDGARKVRRFHLNSPGFDTFSGVSKITSRTPEAENSNSTFTPSLN